MRKIATKIYLLTLLSLFCSTLLFAQNTIDLSGKIIDKNETPIPYATVVVKKDSTEKIITGTTTDEKGDFTLSIPHKKTLLLEVSFLGYRTKAIKIPSTNKNTHLGNIPLEENVNQMDEVLITGEKSTTEFKLDKRVFNVGKDLSSTGASAMEVLNNVPSVNVNIEGQISLRGSSGVQILINGKPSVLASEQGGGLGTITAEMIEKVEVITNPSAKYDAEGSSGIINIILKKEEKKGLNGSISINTGIPQNQSIGISLNKRTEKFNLFSQLGAGYRELPRYNKNINSSLLDTTSIYTEGIEYRNEEFYNFILGTDYHINKNSVLTLSGNFALEVEKQPSNTEFSFEDATGETESTWERSEETEALNPKYQYELQYKNNFKGNDKHFLLFSALGNFFGKDQSSAFTNSTISGENRDSQQETRTNFKEAKYTFNLDYTKPIKKEYTIETGAQYVSQDVSNDFSVSDLVGDSFVVDSNLTNIFSYQQNVLGVYGTGAYEGDKFGIKLGLRIENTDLKTLLENTGERNNRNFSNLFPTLHSSYKISEKFSVQAGYSRRIYRPRLWDLNPFFNIRNSFSIRTGNPDLLPEFTDSYEISSIYLLEKLSLNFSVYKRNTKDVIERVSSFENNVNTFKPLNIGTNDATGVELNTKFTPIKKFSLQGDFNFNYFKRNGSFEGVLFDFSANRWETKWTGKFKFKKDIDLEVTGRYQSKFKTVQGEQSDILSADLGLRKKFMKGKSVLSFSVRDLFVSRIRETIAEQPTFYIYSRGYRGRFITLGFSYGFGKGEAMEYSGRRRG